MTERPDKQETLSRLKDFQRQTVDYVTERMYGRTGARRFLVADEVGLGKTMIARGLVAETIDRLWDSGKRIDIIYVCSNAQIALQNLNRLNPLASTPHQMASRLTLLPLHLQQLESQRVNLVAFTPDTSFKTGNRSGTARERALIHHLLIKIWGQWVYSRSGVWEFMRGAASLEGYERRFDSIDPATISHGVVEEFRKRLDEKPDLEEQFRSMTDGRGRRGSRVDAPTRNQFVSELRHLLAMSCIEILEPDLVILDEFQRFTDLLDPENDAGELASELFNHEQNKVLLLSATPYRMLGGNEDAPNGHYEDFINTCTFLFEEDPLRSEALTRNLSNFRKGLVAGLPISQLEEFTHAIEELLRPVMVRTERLAASPTRDGMLSTPPLVELGLESGDIKTFMVMDQLSRSMNSYGVMDLWKSSPYLLNFMEDYKFSNDFRTRLEQSDPAIVDAIRRDEGFLHSQDLETYQQIDLGNPKLRALTAQLDHHHAFNMLWIPPSMPSVALGGIYALPESRTFTKRLVFSSWAVVPRAVASLLSYRAEQRLLGDSGKQHAERSSMTSPLDLRRDRSSLPVPNLMLTLPLRRLAAMADSREFALASGLTFPLEPGHFMQDVKRRIVEGLADLNIAQQEDGRVDQRWYWIAPLMLEGGSTAVAPWLEFNEEADAELSRTVAEILGHVMKTLVEIESRDLVLGPPPADLAEVVALLAYASPANAWWRALNVITPVDDNPGRAAQMMSSAYAMARALVGVFNSPEAQALVTASTGEAPYWRRTLNYALIGGLSDVLSEYAHVLFDQLGLAGKASDQVLDNFVSAVESSVNLRASIMRMRGWRVHHFTVEEADINLRLHFAARIGQEKEDEKGAERAVSVREAFNSPFWPFVLVSTSVGQEGLDFHPYSHAVVHWNLPSTPVDMEQREGRVHRYKGHAVRKNVASTYLGSEELLESPDSWHQAFELAKRDRPAGATDLIPYWIYPKADGATIERHVLALPFSNEIQRYGTLQRNLAAYRLAFGQPRQEDFIEYLNTWYADEAQQDLVGRLRIDLAPERLSGEMN